MKCQEHRNNDLSNSELTGDDANAISGSSNTPDDHEPLLSTTRSTGLDISSSGMSLILQFTSTSYYTEKFLL